MRTLRSIVFLFAVLLTSVVARSQSALVTQTVDETKLITLHSSVHPLAQPRYDRGAVADSFAAGHMLLLLNRSPEREAALQQLLRDLHTQGSSSFHKWLNPEQLGEQFGPNDSDVQAATGWLGSHGLQVEKISKSRQMIEFSGAAGQVRDAFHTEIHAYSINGATHYANATELSIPAALAPLVRGVSPLNSFFAQPNLEVLGSAAYARSTGKVTPGWTIPTPKGGTFYPLAPEDFATQYDLAPLYQAGVAGAGQTIGILNDSNIDLALVKAYDKLFGLTSPLPQIVIDGTDPGTVSGVSIEAYLDVEEAGAVAPGATVDLYIGDSSSLLDPLYLAALRAVEDNQAGVLSVSFGNCEGFLQASGNALWSSIWEQAAAQGQTVLVSSGDSDSAGCDNAGTQYRVADGLAVNGLSSSPWNVSVGGTDFYYSDYATGGASAAGLWNQTNDANNGSLKATLPEQVWDTAFGLNATGPFEASTAVSVPGAGGGASSCINSSESATQGSPLPFVCNPVTGSTLDGYVKPAWQNVPGVPSDGVRDLPDVALFASNALNFSGYPICASPGDCVPDAGGQTTITIVGGTSAPTPAMAAIFALVNQKYGRQGQADFTLYPLSRQMPTAFHDVTFGSNNVPCAPGTPNCSLDSNGDGLSSLQEYPAKSGYDLASGLGSVDAAVLVNNWTSVSFKATTTTLQITPVTAAHGSAVSFTVRVAPSSGSGTPQGSVAILTNAPAPFSQSAGLLTLNSDGTATGTLTNLPGGTYGVWAQYSGDGTWNSSGSAAQSLTITPGPSTLTLDAFYILNASGSINPAAVCQPVLSSTQAPGGPNGNPLPSGTSIAPYFLPIAAVAIANGDAYSLGIGTGDVTYTLDGATAATVGLNSLGYATWIPTPLLPAGTHTLGATYSGDPSYAPTTASPFSFVVLEGDYRDFTATPAVVCTTSNPGYSCPFNAGDDLTIEVRLEAKSCLYPTGPVTVNLGSLTQNVTPNPGGMGQAGGTVLLGKAVFPDLPAGTYSLSATYPGDANFQAANSTTWIQAISVVATPPPGTLLPSATAITANLSTLSSQSSNLIFNATVTGGSGSSVPPTGNVMIVGDGAAQASGTLSPSGSDTAAVSIAIPLALYYMDFGVNHITAIYSGDSLYKSSASAPSTINYPYEPGPDFLLAPQLPQITVASGNSGTIGLNLAPLYGFNRPVALTCAPSSSQVTCSLNPSSVTVNGLSTSTLTITVDAKTAAQIPVSPQQRFRWPIAPGVLAFAFLLMGGRATRRFRRSMALSLCLVAAMLTISCGSNNGTVTKTQPPPPPPPSYSTYSVVVTATANGVIHNARVTVAVP